MRAPSTSASSSNATSSSSGVPWSGGRAPERRPGTPARRQKRARTVPTPMTRTRRRGGRVLSSGPAAPASRARPPARCGSERFARKRLVEVVGRGDVVEPDRSNNDGPSEPCDQPSRGQGGNGQLAAAGANPGGGVDIRRSRHPRMGDEVVDRPVLAPQNVEAGCTSATMTRCGRHGCQPVGVPGGEGVEISFAPDRPPYQQYGGAHHFPRPPQNLEDGSGAAKPADNDSERPPTPTTGVPVLTPPPATAALIASA